MEAGLKEEDEAEEERSHRKKAAGLKETEGAGPESRHWSNEKLILSDWLSTGGRRWKLAAELRDKKRKDFNNKTVVTSPPSPFIQQGECLSPSLTCAVAATLCNCFSGR